MQAPPSRASDPPPGSHDCPDCLLCGSSISLAAINTRSEGWKAVAQQLSHASSPSSPSTPRHTRQPLVPPSFIYPAPSPSQEARVVHSACWSIAAKIWGTKAFTTAELDGFLDCARNVGPFLPDIPFKESPEQLDVTIDHCLDARDLDDGVRRETSSTPTTATTPTQRQNDRDTVLDWEAMQRSLKQEQLTPPSLIDMQRHQLPPDLESFVGHTLRDASAMRSSPDPDLRFWAQVLAMLANSPAPVFAKHAPHRAFHLAQALRNLHLGGLSRFPHTTNFDIVRANALTILLTLLPIPLEELEPVPEAKRGTKRAGLERPRAVSLDTIPSSSLSSSSSITPPFRLNFYTLRRQRVANTIQDRNLVPGMKYLRCIDFNVSRPAEQTDLVPSITALSGIRLIRDHLGVMAVHARDGIDWLRVWQQDDSTPLTADMALQFTSAEWDSGAHNGTLTITADVSV
ncbi:hypothetical protein E4U55_005818 [Claviceps digitariae]|nr:hypothetical protein E4U55_005818 [Claviceps digitariae]